MSNQRLSTGNSSVLTIEHGGIQVSEENHDANAGAGSQRGMTAPEVIRRIQSWQKKENQDDGLRRHQEMNHGGDQTRDSNNHSSLFILRTFLSGRDSPSVAILEQEGDPPSYTGNRTLDLVKKQLRIRADKELFCK